MDDGRFASGEREGSTFGGLQHHSHGVDVVVDEVDEILMSPLVGGDDAEIISIRESDELFTTDVILGILELEIVTGIDVIEEECEDGIKCEEERYWRQRVALEYSSPEGEWIRVPCWSGHYGFGILVNVLNVALNWIREVISLEGVLDHIVRDAPKGVSQIEERDVKSSFFDSGVLEYWVW